ncbi:MAG: CPBP family intramembrane metalloprotease [Deltaproteobacteria bacterium]|nr:CPBP family intramembrane metalloprotease [Deltaproteobacteria bacterium]
MGGYLRAALIALAIPLLNRIFLALAGFLQLKSVSVSWAEAIRAGAEAPLNLALVQAASVGVLFIVAFPHKSREGGLLEAVHVRPLVGSIVALCFAAGLSLQFTLAEVGNLAQEIWPLSFDELARRYELLTPTTWWGGMSALVAFVLVPPVTEELVFRGWLLPMLQGRYGTPAALVWSSVLFGIVHGEPGAILYATLGGLVLGAVALRTKSTLASIALHAGINAAPLLLPVAVVRIEGFNTLPGQVEHISLWLILLSILVTAGLLTVLWRSTEDDGPS